MIDIDYILNKGKCVMMPYGLNETYTNGKRFSYNDLSFFTNKIQTYYTYSNNGYKDRYYLDYSNEHHYTTKWHYNNSLKSVIQAFNLDFDIGNYTMISNKTETGDFSYLVPRKLYTYNVLYPKITFNGEYYDYEWVVEEENSLTISSPVLTYIGSAIGNVDSKYHKLFKYSHISCSISNETLKSGKNLLIISDSQIIPLIPILLTLYKKVTLLDSHYKIDGALKILTENDCYDDVLLFLWNGNGVDNYLNELRIKDN